MSSINLDENGRELDRNTILIQASPSKRACLKDNEIVYLYYLKVHKMNKVKAYMSAYPESTEFSAKKNVAKIDKRIRAKHPLEYQTVIDEINGKAVTVEETSYMNELVKCKDKKNAIKAVRPDLGRDGQKSAIIRLERSLTAKMPDWREQLTSSYDPAVYFAKLDAIARGEGSYVTPDVQRKAALDMLQFQNFIKGEDARDAARADRLSKYSDQIDRIINIKVEDGATLNITKADDVV